MGWGEWGVGIGRGIRRQSAVREEVAVAVGGWVMGGRRSIVHWGEGVPIGGVDREWKGGRVTRAGKANRQ